MAEETIELLSGIYERWGKGDFGPEPSFLDDMTLALGPDSPIPASTPARRASPPT